VLARVPQNYTMCTDGTFAVVPHQFTQMLLVLVTVNERLVPAYTGATWTRPAQPHQLGQRRPSWWWGVVTVLLPSARPPGGGVS